MSESNSYGGEPQKFFVNKLIYLTTEIEQAFYFGDVGILKILSAIEGLIHLLDENSQNDLTPILDQIERMQDNTKLIQKREVKNMFRNLMQYLHTGYLQELRFAKPKFTKRGKI